MLGPCEEGLVLIEASALPVPKEEGQSTGSSLLTGLPSGAETNFSASGSSGGPLQMLGLALPCGPFLPSDPLPVQHEAHGSCRLGFLLLVPSF